MKYGVKLRIYPNTEQEQLLFYYCKVYHNSWNFLVNKYKDTLPTVNTFGIKDYKENDLYNDMIEDIPRRIYLGVLKTFAFASYRRYKCIANMPKFHKYNPNKQSFYVAAQQYLISRGTIPLPKLRTTKVASRQISINQDDLNYYKCTYIIEPRYTYYKGQWYVSGCFNKDDVQINKDKEILGLDWGVKNFYTDSNGNTYNYPKSVLREFQRIKKLDAIKHRKQIGSINYKKIKQKISEAYIRMNNIKYNFIERLTTSLAKEKHIIIEDIAMREFLYHKKQYKYITRNNIIAPKYIFDDKLYWKCQKYGSYFIKVDAKKTSMSCSSCGYIKYDMTLSDRMFICPECGLTIDRDVNAALNIRERGIEQISQ